MNLFTVRRNAVLFVVIVQTAAAATAAAPQAPGGLPVRRHGVGVHVSRANAGAESGRQVLDGSLESRAVPSVLYLWI